MFRLSTLSAAMCLLTVGVFSSTATAQSFTVTDILDRKITFEKPVERIMIGDGRLLYPISALQKDKPFEKIVAWSDDMISSSPTLWEKFSDKFPEALELPVFGSVTDGEVSSEQLISFDADVLVLGKRAENNANEAAIIETLAQLGTQVVFIDIQEYPQENTDRSVRILGQLFGKTEKAEEFIAWRTKQSARVTDVIAKSKPEKPLVFIDRFPGPPSPCCKSYGPANFGMLVELAGGVNLASQIMSVSRVTLNPEQIVASKPEVYIATGSDFATDRAIVRLHAGTDLKAAQEALRGVTSGPAFVGSPALENGRVHAIWHLFEANSYDVVALQVLATWIHPDLFAGLDPQATFKELHDKFLPFEYQSGYWVSLSSDLIND